MSEKKDQNPAGNSKVEKRLAGAPKSSLLTDVHAREDLDQGQRVVITARWILVFAGILLTIWNPGQVEELRVQVVLIILLAVANFNLNLQLLRKTATNPFIWYAASAADLGVITLLILSSAGYGSELYVFYFPAILAFSIAFPTLMTLLYVAGVSAVYFLIGMAALVFNDADLLVILARLIMFFAVALCGNLYFRMEARRRQDARQSQEVLMKQIKKRRKAAAAA